MIPLSATESTDRTETVPTAPSSSPAVAALIYQESSDAYSKIKCNAKKGFLYSQNRRQRETIVLAQYRPYKHIPAVQRAKKSVLNCMFPPDNINDIKDVRSLVAAISPRIIFNWIVCLVVLFSVLFKYTKDNGISFSGVRTVVHFNTTVQDLESSDPFEELSMKWVQRASGERSSVTMEMVIASTSSWRIRK
ncbi:hypothetical protein DFJ73DRAFT_793739 [Zopfochytrium polystomum]|nr:hypothetical protein DFJ73DRAFT_793739 [Zopfochytrium polystomum]